MSAPTCTQAPVPAFQSNTRTWPELYPLPSSQIPPAARRDPSALRDTEWPNQSPAASPSMSAPTCTQALVPVSQSNTRTWPASVPLPSFSNPPTARRDPSALRLTEWPNVSPAASPSTSGPI